MLCSVLFFSLSGRSAVLFGVADETISIDFVAYLAYGLPASRLLKRQRCGWRQTVYLSEKDIELDIYERFDFIGNIGCVFICSISIISNLDFNLQIVVELRAFLPSLNGGGLDKFSRQEGKPRSHLTPSIYANKNNRRAFHHKQSHMAT
jgi:hypothetical protein